MAFGPLQSCKVYTPRRVADAMVTLLKESRSQRWLEPGCGTGVFLQAMEAQGISSRQIVGVDLESKELPTDRFGEVFRGIDFLAWSAKRKAQFDCVAGNPPFLAISSLPDPLRSRAASILGFDNQPIGFRANTWYAFVLQSTRLLRERGNMAFVLPAACEYADYCKNGRSTLTKLFDRVDLIRSRSPLFSEVAEGAVVLICRHKGGGGNLYRRHEVDGVEEVLDRLNDLYRLRARTCPDGKPTREQATVKLSSVLDIRLGGVTGDAGYFVLTESQRLKHKLPQSAFLPVVSRSRQVARPAMRSSDFEAMRLADERVWLFCPSTPDLSHPAVRRYLRLDAKNGGCRRDRYKIRNRKPWYVTPMPDSVDGFLSGMNSKGLWICMRETPGLNATNTLYVASFEEMSQPRKYAWALALLTTIVSRQISRTTRVYADGLHKLEPGQILALDVPVPPELRNSISLYRTACEQLLCGKESHARMIADEAILQYPSHS